MKDIDTEAKIVAENIGALMTANHIGGAIQLQAKIQSLVADAIRTNRAEFCEKEREYLLRIGIAGRRNTFLTEQNASLVDLSIVAKALLEWIDAVPSDVVASLPAMPGVDRDWVDEVIVGVVKPPFDEQQQFEAFMAEKFGDSIDQRRCLNGDGGYMSWDMIVGYSCWKHRSALNGSAKPAKPLKLPNPVNAKMGGDKVTKAMFSGMNMMLSDCRKALEADGYVVAKAVKDEQ